MTTNTAARMFGLSTIFLASALVSDAAISSTFDNGPDGWRAIGDSATSIPNWNAIGGNPGGYVEVTDDAVGGVWYWDAPLKFLGNRSDAIGQTLSFDLRQSSITNQFNDVDIYLRSGAESLVFNLPDNPGLTFTSYTVTLDVGEGWRRNSLVGLPATSSDFQDILGALTGLEIRGEYVDGPDTGSLDNVILVPESSTSAGIVAISVLASVALWRRRR